MECVKTIGLKRTYTSNVGMPVEALSGVDFTVEKGEFLALVGPSGSGKTTLLNMIGGLDEPTEGKVFMEEREITGLSGGALAELRLQRIGFIFQEYNLIPVLSAVENVEYVLLLQGVQEEERRERARNMLDEVGLKGMEDRRPRQLSGGQQQRVAIARAIVAEPVLVLADEPTANLDSVTGAALLDLMREENEKRATTFIFSTHDPMVMERARRVVRLKDGHIVVEP
ncbi:MAG: ABC transporter ATP-binding protein [Thermodesulfobacteriota bacterium]